MELAEYIGVIGAGECSKTTYRFAEELGFEIGKKGWAMVCGGLGGVMEASARGCKEAGGMTVGLLPGLDRAAANPFIEIALPTGLGEGRNLLVVRTADVIISVAGGYGTLSEIALALKMKKPVIGLGTWEDIEGVQYVSSPREAIQRAARCLSPGQSH